MTYENSLEIVNSIFADQSRSDILDQINSVLSQKSLEQLQSKKLEVAKNFFNTPDTNQEEEDQ